MAGLSSKQGPSKPVSSVPSASWNMSSFNLLFSIAQSGARGSCLSKKGKFGSHGCMGRSSSQFVKSK
jgi:hypothetical protein